MRRIYLWTQDSFFLLCIQHLRTGSYKKINLTVLVMQRFYQPLHHLHSTRQVPQESQQGHHPDHGKLRDYLLNQLFYESTFLFE